ncbi:helix-turn-helix domain-containing protein [Acinetobacter qingfengensis]|uniref:DNA-binding protein n=1 Tax=Acinetobacter qingfengensis TaxID=1262585 RepID=A0A1E7QYW1_9GAMM|nr:helix-turn-helix domain-containing protein [Acinetobacter qingfengensis]KAA8730999.1 helix-turn-helix domain-containing protein [Acinetobacter qingfengensis]OEY92223.1 DNA-binding protein [Acinetobacter qingfengensis]
MSYAITDQIRKLKVGNPTAKAVLLRLADYANDNGECFPSISLIADETEFSVRAIKTAIDLLEEVKIIQVDRSNGRHNRYKITPENFTPKTKKQSKSSGEKSTNQCNTFTSAADAPVQQMHVTSAADAPEPVQEVHTNHHITTNNHQLSSSNTHEEKISQPPAQFVQYHNFDLVKISVIELSQKYQTLKFDFIELSKPRHPDLDQHDLENLFDEFGDWFASPNDFGKQSSKTPQKWAVSWLTWVNNNKHKIIARKAKATASERSALKPQATAQPSAYQAKQENVNRWRNYGERSNEEQDKIIDVVPQYPKSFLIEEVGHA